MKKQREKSYKLADIIIRYLFKSSNHGVLENDEILVGFSIIELQNVCKKCGEEVSTTDIEKTLLFLSKISSVKLEGGFLVLYSGMKLKRLVMDNKIRYKNEDYKQLNEFYKQKIQQIHIVGEYANMMVRSYEAALKFVNDYFQMDYKKFLSVYFKGERATEIERNITPEKYRQLFDTLSERQLEIIKDDTSQYIVCTAGPGSGKTRVLVHILKLKSGTELEVEGRRLYCNYCGEKYPVAQFSRDCSNRIQSITQKGYTIKSARIRYVVAWKGENDERETAIILPDVDLKLV